MLTGLKRLLNNLHPSTGRSLTDAVGFSLATGPTRIDEEAMTEYINIKLAALGWPIFGSTADYETLSMAKELLEAYRARVRQSGPVLPPVDLRVQHFLNDYFADEAARGETVPQLPADTFILDRHGLARTLSLPPDQDKFESNIISSYRTARGVLHNPASDRRTTKGVFHVVEGGSPIPWDKKAVPKTAFLRLLQIALQPPDELATLPFTSNQEDKARGFVSLMLRPVVCPRVEGFIDEKTMEVRFFVPGNLISNLDFVESIFGNAGDPYLPENDAALDTDHWTGTTGCIILAPHMVNITKKELGLPHISEATERQKRDSMCWETEDEKYNDGGAFKLTCRDCRGVVITLIADNYFGYCKKEVKTQISYSANLYGLVEEEHAGGALAFPSYDLGEDFTLSRYQKQVNHTFQENLERYGDLMQLQPEGYAIDSSFGDIVYVPENVHFNLHEQLITWTADGVNHEIQLLPGKTYVLPSGYKVEMVKPAKGRRWRLAGTRAEGVDCHKPCTVSGGGKSEISKSIADAIINGPVFINDFKRDFEQVKDILNKDYSNRFKHAPVKEGETRFLQTPGTLQTDGRPLLSPERSLGSVIKLLTQHEEYTDEYNSWLESIPVNIKELVFIIKRFYKPDWGDNWLERFSVDVINGLPGNELKYKGNKLLSSFLRLGFDQEGNWRTFGLRKDFIPAAKIQEEDDISASVVVPNSLLGDGLPSYSKADHPSFKFLKNCEYRLFQRPDEAINRGYDKQTEFDLAQPGNFISNFEPLTKDDVREMCKDVIRFDSFTEPMHKTLSEFARSSSRPSYVVSSSNPRIVDGKPTKNPRYLQTRPDLVDVRARYLHNVGTRFFRRVPLEQPVHMPVTAVLPGRRQNPPVPADNIPALCSFNPIHHLELPELFMEFISSLTGKSPSTTGAGSEGALTKAPFNALPPVIDLNNALVSYFATQYDVFITAAGYVGPHYRVDHDISLLVPEIWSRMMPHERRPDNLIKEGSLEKLEDFEYQGRTVRASVMGYRITDVFVKHYFARIFSNPGNVFEEKMLKPELQDMQIYVDSIDIIVETYRRVAENYFADGSIEYACPPLKALLHIMAKGNYEGKTLADPEIRDLFDARKALQSEWYQQRLEAGKLREVELLTLQKNYLAEYMAQPANAETVVKLKLNDRLAAIESELANCSRGITRHVVGTIGLDPATKIIVNHAG